MPDYSKVVKEQPRGSYLSSFVRWLQLKKYQYEVTFSLYMLTSTEKFIFNLILFILISLLVTAASLYLPDHIAVIYNRIWYYVRGGEIAYMTTAAATGDKTSLAGEGLRLTSGTLRAGAAATLREL
ncbi:uncharacterized protein A1O9_02980 [Exophiala aquamarina CBS 119918]|uniref:Uncharacterized protein n=1 Tax=Exophiala aquamarina CBS 119918 TaxID=1182545 RepID=A0A072PMV8_9EURO|nr:uncharacterized protein A1O9_02980 [Exophiala aquamarina CBS 119918]KEF61414.1 hypothetical protein A1O9_02980 [Exophiala aquamarina CBS 119918]